MIKLQPSHCPMCSYKLAIYQYVDKTRGLELYCSNKLYHYSININYERFHVGFEILNKLGKTTIYLGDRFETNKLFVYSQEEVEKIKLLL